MILIAICCSFLVCTDGIEKSVGKRGVNQPQDVRRVQSILNQVPVQVGGPRQPLEVTGVADPSLVRAIERFQKIQLGFADGRVDPGLQTETRLNQFQSFADQDRGEPKIVWGKLVTASFKKKVLDICKRQKMDPNHLMAAMAFETAGTFSPAIKNGAGSGATGLIQFMPSTAKGLGTTTAQLAKLSGEEQLDLVEAYFRPYAGRCNTLSDVYMAILWPAAVGKSEDFVLFDKATKPKTYRMNQGLDKDRNGKITKSEAATLVTKKLKLGKQFSD